VVLSGAGLRVSRLDSVSLCASVLMMLSLPPLKVPLPLSELALLPLCPRPLPLPEPLLRFWPLLR
jgi:hypothetical protein